jgi:hypothetical protein
MYAKDGSRILMKVITQTSKVYKQEIRTMRKEADQDRNRYEKIIQSNEDYKKEINDKVEFERKYFKDQKKVLEDALEDARLALSGNSEEYTLIQKKLRQENLELSKQILELNKKSSVPQVIQPDITGIKEYIQEIIKDSKQAKQDKALTDLKLEYEMKINSIL